MIINVYQDLIIKIEIIIKKDLEIRRAIYIKKTIIISTLLTISILTTYYNTLLKNKDFLFEPQYKQNLEYKKNIFAYIVNFSFFFIQFRNFLNRSTRIIRKIHLNFIIEFREKEYYLITFETISLIAKN